MNKTLRVLLVDDEEAGRKALRELLAAHPILEIVGEADSAETAVPLFNRHAPHLIFLDIQMPRGDGFSLLYALRPPPAVIFVTAYNEFAVRAFEVNAVDYLLKPVRQDRLAQALERVFSQRSGSAKPFSKDDRIFLRADSGMRFVSANEIACVEAEGNYSRVHLVKKPSMFVRRGMSEWESLLPDPPFLRVHRSYIVNLMTIENILPESHEHVRVIFNGSAVFVVLALRPSRRLRQAIREIKLS